MIEKPTYEELLQRIQDLEQAEHNLVEAENALKESEKRYRSLIHKIQAAVVVHGPDTQINVCNQKAQELLGLKQDQILGRNATDPEWKFLNANGNKMSLEQYPVNQVLATRLPLRDLTVGIHCPGKVEIVWVLVNADPVFDDKGQIQQVIVTFMDISETKRTNEALWESEERYRNVYSTAPLAFVIWDRELRVTDWNKRSEKIFGWSRDEVMGRNFFEFLIPRGARPQVEVAVNRLLQGELPSQNINKNLTKEGGILLIEWNNSILYDNEGHVVGAISLGLDITDRKVAENTLQESEEKYRQLFELESDAIFLIEKETGKILEVNASAPKIYGFSREELLTMKNIDLSAEPEKTEQATRDQLNQVPLRYHRKKDGSVFPVEITASHLDWKGRKAHIAAIRDISFRVEAETERAKLEKELFQARKMESIGTLAGGVAHDFNNILFMITGNAELALEDIPEWNPVHFNLKQIKAAGLRAAGIVKQLLNFSPRTAQELRPIGAVTIIKDTIKFLRSSIPATIEIHKRLPDTEIMILSDPILINQVLMNICTNAAQAMEVTGGILKINVQTESLTEDLTDHYPGLTAGEHVKITVSDTGPGIDPEIIGRIFDPYFTTKGIGKGSGMGLAVVHGIVKNHNGAITVKSGPGKGTTFTLLFPVVVEKPEMGSKIPDEKPFGNKKILFVDDEQAITSMSRQILERLGYEVKTKNNPVEALELFQTCPDEFDLVITDMTMPQMTGVRLSEKLREVRPDLPVIVCTGHSALIDEEKAKKLGIAAYVMKPIIKSEIAKIIRRVLDINEGPG